MTGNDSNQYVAYIWFLWVQEFPMAGCIPFYSRFLFHRLYRHYMISPVARPFFPITHMGGLPIYIKGIYHQSIFTAIR